MSPYKRSSTAEATARVTRSIVHDSITYYIYNKRNQRISTFITLSQTEVKCRRHLHRCVGMAEGASLRAYNGETISTALTTTT